MMTITDIINPFYCIFHLMGIQAYPVETKLNIFVRATHALSRCILNLVLTFITLYFLLNLALFITKDGDTSSMSRVELYGITEFMLNYYFLKHKQKALQDLYKDLLSHSLPIPKSLEFYTYLILIIPLIAIFGQVACYVSFIANLPLPQQFNDKTIYGYYIKYPFIIITYSAIMSHCWVISIFTYAVIGNVLIIEIYLKFMCNYNNKLFAFHGTSECFKKNINLHMKVYSIISQMDDIFSASLLTTTSFTILTSVISILTIYSHMEDLVSLICIFSAGIALETSILIIILIMNYYSLSKIVSIYSKILNFGHFTWNINTYNMLIIPI